MVAARTEVPPAVVALLGSGAALDLTLDSLRPSRKTWRGVVCAPRVPADAAMLSAWEDTTGLRFERVAVAADASPARRLAVLLEAAGSDVIVLGPGVSPAPGSLATMASSLAHDPRIASATPWSNDGELAGFPRIGECQPVPGDLAMLEATLQRVPGDPELPLGGCHAIALSARALREVGGLDAESWFSTYAALTDLTLRQGAHGWRHVLCGRAYVAAHLEQGPTLDDLHLLNARYPTYGRQVAEFLMHDPLRELRVSLTAVPHTAPAEAAAQPDLFR
jgi:hypothetical protein